MPLQNRVGPWGTLEAVSARYPEPSAMMGNRGCLHDDDRTIVRPSATKAWLSCRLRIERTRKRQRDDNRAFNGRSRVPMTPHRYVPQAETPTNVDDQDRALCESIDQIDWSSGERKSQIIVERFKYFVPFHLVRYTELFFLDEYVSLAAGHRPCGCCRRGDYTRFLALWEAAHPDAPRPATARAVDGTLHTQRWAGTVGGGGAAAARGGAKASKATFCVARAELGGLPDGTFVALRGESDGGGGEDAWLIWRGALHRWTHEGYRDRRRLGAVVDEAADAGGGTADGIRVLTPRGLVAVLAAGYQSEFPPHASAEPFCDDKEADSASRPVGA